MQHKLLLALAVDDEVKMVTQLLVVPWLWPHPDVVREPPDALAGKITRNETG